VEKNAMIEIEEHIFLQEKKTSYITLSSNSVFKLPRSPIFFAL